MSKLLLVLICCALCIGLLLFGTARYVRPAEPLDLAYSELSWQTKLKDMLAVRKLQAELTEDELTQLVRKSLSRKPGVTKHVTVTGARAYLHGDKLQLDVTGLYREHWPFGASLYFDLEWNNPNVVAVHTGTTVRQLPIPQSILQLPPISINLAEQLPYPLGVRSVQFEPSSLIVGFKLQL